MVGGLNAEAAEFIPTAAAAPRVAARASNSGGDHRRNPRRAGTGEVGSTGHQSRKSAGRRDSPSNGGRGDNPVQHQRKKSSSTRREAVHQGRAHEENGVAESPASVQHGGGRRVHSSSGGRPARDATAQYGRSRNKSSQRRRRSQDERVHVGTVVDDGVSGGVPRPPRPKRAARGGEAARASGSSRSRAGRPLSGAIAEPAAQSGGGRGADGPAAEVSLSEGGEKIDPSRGAGWKLPPPRLEEGEREEDFPSLPPASGHTPSPTLAMAQPGSLDYSALAERLAVETAAAVAAAAASSPSGADGGTVRGTISRLSVLPGFRDVRRCDDRLRGASSEDPPEPPPVLQVCGTSSPKLVSAEDNVSGGSLAPVLRSRPADGSNRLRAGAETVALRVRLRERWFRLEAARKAQRQRESAERDLMDAEDSAARAHEGDGGAGSSGARAKRRDCCSDPPGAADGDSSGAGRESGEGNTSSSSSSSSSDEVSGQERQKLARSSSRTASASRVQPSAAASRPGGFGASGGVSAKSDNTSAGASPGTEAGSSESRAVSAAGIAAIKRSEAAAAASAAAAAAAALTVETMASIGPDAVSPACQDLSMQDASGRTDVSEDKASDSDPDGAAGAASMGQLERTEIDAGQPREGDGNSGGGVPGLHGEERVHAACEAGLAALLNDLLVRSGGRVADGKDKSRRTPLHLAADAGSLECVSLLLKRGTRLDQRDKWRETPLHKAARSRNAGVVKALCAARMKVNVRNRLRETPLLLAVRANAVDAVAVLLGFGARLDDPDVNGVTPIVQAVRSGHTELLMAMANSNQAWRSSNREEAVPKTVAAAMADPASKARGNATAGGRRALPSSLYQGLAVSKGRGGGGRGGGNGIAVPALSPVHEAAASGQTETLSLLLQLGVSTEERDSAAGGGGGGDTPLGRAVRAGRLDCAKLLLEAGAMIGRENTRGETALVIAIRAGQASSVELLTRHGAPLEGGRSNGRLIAADGRAPVGAREKMMARRSVEPLELALREGQFACAAVLIEGGARITERALRSVKLEPASVASREKSTTQGARARYAGTGADGSYHGGAWSGMTAGRSVAASASANNVLPLQTDIRQLMSPEISEFSESAPPDGGGLEDNPACDSSAVRDGMCEGRDRLWQGEDVVLRRESRGASAGSTEVPTYQRPGQIPQYVGGLLVGLGECDLVLVLDDGSRLPVHCCLLAAFSGTFRDLFLSGDGLNCRGLCRASCDRGDRCSGGEPAAGPSTGTSDASSCAGTNGGGGGCVDDQRKCSRDVELLLEGRSSAGEEAGNKRPRAAPGSTSEAAIWAAALAAASIAENTGGRQAPAVVEWELARGDVLVRFWGAGTMAAVVRHVYTGQPPADMQADGLGRLLAASVALRMPRLMRQVEHLLAASLSSQKGNDRPTQLKEVVRLLRAARSLRATDLERRCTLYLQANGGFPSVMKLRRELRVPALNASDVTRGLARLTGSGYLGSGPAHAWSSSGASGSPVVAAAKRAVDLSLRKRAVDFDQLVPLLLDPPRCASTLSVGYPERTVLLSAALAAACPGRTPTPGHDQQEQAPRSRPPVCCGRGCSSSSSSSSSGGGQPANPLASNFAAFSRGMGWLLRTGTVADVLLVLPGRPCTAVVDPGAISRDIEEEHDEEEKEEGEESDTLRAEVGHGAGGQESGARAAAGAADTSHPGTPGNVPEKDGRRRRRQAAAVSPPAKEEAAEEGTTAGARFLAHSMVLAARSEKFAAMLRFVRRQDDDGQVLADRDAPDGAGGGTTTYCRDCRHAILSCGSERGDVDAPEEPTCWGLQDRGPLPPASGGRTPRQCRCQRGPPVRRPRRNPNPRELELHSPLLSPRSLGQFLEFLYTGVLSPSLSTGEMSELALIADEYLVPDLTRQVEALLVESLAIRTAGGCSYSSLTTIQAMGGHTTPSHSKRDEDTASIPLDVLQLGVSLGLPELSAAAARAVLLQLERVSRSEAFEASGMSKRELILAALEAVRS